MKVNKVLMAFVLLVFLPSLAAAGDFDWTRDFNIRAEADPSGFRAQMASRFKVGDAQITAVLGNVGKPADAYMVFRLGEMSAKPPEYVIEQYKSGKSRGWGEIAKSLGIKPGSREFHALKSGHDLYAASHTEKGKGKGKGQGKGKR